MHTKRIPIHIISCLYLDPTLTGWPKSHIQYLYFMNDYWIYLHGPVQLGSGHWNRLANSNIIYSPWLCSYWPPLLTHYILYIHICVYHLIRTAQTDPTPLPLPLPAFHISAKWDEMNNIRAHNKSLIIISTVLILNCQLAEANEMVLLYTLTRTTRTRTRTWNSHAKPYRNRIVSSM